MSSSNTLQIENYLLNCFHAHEDNTSWCFEISERGQVLYASDFEFDSEDEALKRGKEHVENEF